MLDHGLNHSNRNCLDEKKSLFKKRPFFFFFVEFEKGWRSQERASASEATGAQIRASEDVPGAADLRPDPGLGRADRSEAPDVRSDRSNDPEKSAPGDRHADNCFR